MLPSRWRRGPLLLALALLASTACREQVRLGVPPTLAPREVEVEAATLAAHLGRAAQVEMTVLVPADYGGLVDALAEGRVDLARLPAQLYIDASRRLGEAIVTLAQADFGSEGGYAGYLIARADAPFQSLAEVRGRSFAWVDPSSSSGYVLPRRLLHEHGVDPDRELGPQRFARSHDAVIAAVLSGEAEVGAVWNATYKAAPDALLDRLKILGTTAPIPPDVVVARAAIDAGLRERLRAALLGLRELPEAERRALREATGLWGFVAPDLAAMRALETSAGAGARDSIPRP